MNINSKSNLKKQNCEICGKGIIPLEKFSVEGRQYHINCLRCAMCQKVLKAGEFVMVGETYYCLPHSRQGRLLLKQNSRLSMEIPSLPTIPVTNNIKKKRVTFHEQVRIQEFERDEHENDDYVDIPSYETVMATREGSDQTEEEQHTNINNSHTENEKDKNQADPKSKKKSIFSFMRKSKKSKNEEEKNTSPSPSIHNSTEEIPNDNLIQKSPSDSMISIPEDLITSQHADNVQDKSDQTDKKVKKDKKQKKQKKAKKKKDIDSEPEPKIVKKEVSETISLTDSLDKMGDKTDVLNELPESQNMYKEKIEVLPSDDHSGKEENVAPNSVTVATQLKNVLVLLGFNLESIKEEHIQQVITVIPNIINGTHQKNVNRLAGLEEELRLIIRKQQQNINELQHELSKYKLSKEEQPQNIDTQLDEKRKEIETIRSQLFDHNL